MTHNTDPLTLKLSLREKCAYGMGDFGSNLMLCIGTLYLLKFYTDELGMPAFYGGIIFLVAKFFTAFTAMLTGVLLDSRRNIGARGKFRPFILYASVPVALVDTVGAGDTFQAALLTALAEGGALTSTAMTALDASALHAMLDFANRAAALTCSRRGADLPRRDALQTQARLDFATTRP